MTVSFHLGASSTRTRREPLDTPHHLSAIMLTDRAGRLLGQSNDELCMSAPTYPSSPPRESPPEINGRHQRQADKMSPIIQYAADVHMATLIVTASTPYSCFPRLGSIKFYPDLSPLCPTPHSLPLPASTFQALWKLLREY